MKRKVLIITAFDPFSFKGGIETYTIQLVKLLRKHDIETVISHTGLINEEHGFFNDYLGKLFLLGKKLSKCDKEYDFIVANAFYGLGYFPVRIKTYNIFHLTHVAFAEMIKEVVPLPQYLEWKLLWGKLAEFASGLGRIKIAVSESVKNELFEYYGFDDVKIVVNGIDTNIFAKIDKIQSRQRWSIPEKKFVGLYVGRWDILKGCDIFEQIIDKRTDVYWVIVLGTGSSKSSVPVRENVKVIEQIDHERMREIYSAADFMLFLSRYEGCGYTILEAMACELPVITTNIGVAKTIYKSEPFDTLVLPNIPNTPHDKDVFISLCLRKIDILKNDDRLKAVICKEGRRVIEKEFTLLKWEKEMTKILGLRKNE